ncbi:hypothetical protein THRCLA_21256 [Thraustotheca clavata]|uniref:G-patch domain-containing protein n=1 Tax=Thraustotheca clavata TaxID=74557 RepID=A0A1V9ZYE6_9STRA|nr:hypothetical protein THRCLA_21256 [Thraustotheca clavata]
MEKRRRSDVYELKRSNVGYRLLESMGWKEGEGLGSAKQGRTEPVATCLKRDRAGLGSTKLTYRVTHVEQPPKPIVQQAKLTPQEKKRKKEEIKKKVKKERVYAQELYCDDIPEGYEALFR